MVRRVSAIALFMMLLLSSLCYAEQVVPISSYGAAMVMQRYQNCPYRMNRQADFRYAMNVYLNPAVDFDRYGFMAGTQDSLAAIALMVNKAGYVNHIVLRTWNSTTSETMSQAITSVLYGAGLDLNDISGVVNSIQSAGNGIMYGRHYCSSIGCNVLTKLSPMPDGDGLQWLFFAGR